MHRFKKGVIGLIFYEMLCLTLSGQNFIQLNNPPEKNVNQQSPFDKISVIDNRFDSVFFTYLDGSYPIKKMNFKNGFSNQITGFLGSLYPDSNKGSNELILMFNQFRIANTTILDSKFLETDSMKRKQSFSIRASDLFLKKGSQVALYSRMNGREMILVSVDLFYKAEGRITKIASAKSNIFLFYENFSEAISEFLIKLYNVAELAFYKHQPTDDKNLAEKSKINVNGIKVIFYNAKTFYPSDSLQVSVNKKWESYPIVNSIQPDSNGYFRYYLLFLNNDFVKGDIRLQFDSEDSTYIYVRLRKDDLPKMPLILFYDQEYFLRVFENRYVRIYKKGNTFHFHVPYTYPNAYQWLSHSRDLWKSPQQDIDGLKSMFTYPDRLLSEGKEISKIKSQIKNGSINKDDNFKKYRDCFFDMDTGDIIFH